jgi:hypothetical protein
MLMKTLRLIALAIAPFCVASELPAVPSALTTECATSAADLKLDAGSREVHNADLLDAYLLTAATVFSIDHERLDEFGRTRISVPDPLNGAPLDLVLRPYSVRSTDFVLISFDAKGREILVEPPPPTTIRGMVEGDPESRIAGSLVEGRLTASIQLGDGRRLFVESLAFTVAGVGVDEHLIYDTRELQKTEMRCGVDGEHGLGHHDDREFLGGEGGTARSEGGTAGGVLCDVKVAIDVDFPYFMATGATTDSVAIRVEQLLNIVSDQYESEVGIRKLLTGIVVRNSAASDPYTTNALCVSNGLEHQVRDVWTNQDNPAAPFPLIRRKIVHLFTGRIDPTSTTIGCAFLGDVCQTTVDLVAHGANRAAFSPNTAFITDLIAHEMGHNWNAEHCSCSSPPSTMNPTLTGANTFGSSPADGQITSWRNAHSWCLGCGLTNDGCGDQLAGSAWAVHSSPYAYQSSCCARVCAADPFCGNFIWDASCAIAARSLCAGCGDPATGSPFTARMNPGCSDTQCCGIVCVNDPRCCDTSWDQVCVNQSESVCRSGHTCTNANLMDPQFPESYRFDTTSNPYTYGPSLCGTSDIRAAFLRYRPLSSGMSTLSICTEFAGGQVTITAYASCTTAPFACSATPTTCELPNGSVQVRFAGLAGRTYLIRVGANNGQDASGAVAVVENGACETSGACPYPHSTPGCSNPECCVKVCSIDPFCCDNRWDQLCANEARDLCYSAADANFDGEVNATDLSILLGGWGGGGAGDVNGDGVTDGADLSILLSNWG